jgi:hypothetical protein
MHDRSLVPSSEIGDLKKLLSSLGLGERAFDPESEGYALSISCSIIRHRGSKKIAELTWAWGNCVCLQ